MSTDSSGADRDPVGLLAEEFAGRLRRGEHPSISEYEQRHPELAEGIRDLFPALALLEQFKSDAGGRKAADGDARHSAGLLDRLGDYLILREIGRGGMGVVYEAEQESLSRHVALKVLPSTSLPNQQTIQRFRREARSAARLHHTNIVPVFGVGDQEGLQYYVMQYIHGRGLDEVIKELRQLWCLEPKPQLQARSRPPLDAPSTGAASVADVALAIATGHFAPRGGATAAVQGDPAPPTIGMTQSFVPPEVRPETPPGTLGSADDRMSLSSPSTSGLETSKASSRPYWMGVARVGVQVARGLEYAHSQGILHRDIKPSNLLLDLHGTVWVTDFGLAKAIADVDLTNSGDIIGTLRYMAPERFNGVADARSDIYALGLTLYELLTLKPAFEASDRNHLIQVVMEAAPPRPRRLVPEIPLDLETICLKCIEKEPARRYATAGALADDLECWLEGRPISARPISALERGIKWARRKPAIAGLVSFSAASVLGGLVLTTSYNVRLVRALTESRRQQDLAERSVYIAKINLVGRSIEVGQIASALGNLDQLGPPERRGFEWHYLRRLCDYELHSRHETGIPIQAVAYSADGKRVATGHGYSTQRGFDARPGIVQVRDAEDGQLLLQFEAHQGPVFDLAFNSDGTIIATGGGDHLVKLWDSSTGLPRGKPLEGFRHEVNGVAFSFDGRYLAAGGGDRYTDLDRIAQSPGTVALWDVADGNQLWRKDDSTGAVLSILFDPLGNRLAWGTQFRFTFCRPEDGTIVTDTGFSGGSGGGRPAFSADGQWMGTFGNGTVLCMREQGAALRSIRLSNSYGWTSGLVFQPPSGEHAAMAFAYSRPEDPEFVVNRRRLNIVWIWEPRRMGPLFSLVAHKSAIRDFKYRPPRGDRLATADAEGVLLFWTPTRAKPVATVRIHPAAVRAVVFSPDGRHVASANEAGVVSVEDTEAAGPPRDARRHDHAIFALAYSPDGRQIASGGQDSSIVIGPPGPTGPSRTLNGHTGAINGLAFQPGGARLASASGDGSIRIWDLRTERSTQVLGDHAVTVNAVAYTPDGRRLAAVDGDGVVRLLDGDSGQLLLKWPAHEGLINALAFLGGDAGLIATAGTDRTIRIWDARDGRLIRELTGHTQDVLALASGGVGQPRLVSAGKDQVVRLWDPETGQEVLSLAGHTGSVVSLCYSPDGRVLASAGADRSIRLWDARPSPFVKTNEREQPGQVIESPDR